MPILSPFKKSLVAAAVLAPLVLGACSSAAEESTDQGSTTAAEAANGGTTAAKAGNSADADASASEVEAAEATEGAEGETTAVDPETIDPAAAAADPLASGQITFAELVPVEGGQPASAEDQAQIEGLVNGMYEAETLHGFLGYLPANTCNEVIQEQGGAAAFDLNGVPDLPLAAIPSYAESQARIDSITDVQIDGEVASAMVTATSNGQSTTDVQRFRQEDGAWKFCN